MEMAMDFIEEIIKQKDIEKYSFLTLDRYQQLLGNQQQYFVLSEDDNKKIQTLFNHLNRIIKEKNIYMMEIAGKYNTFQLLIGLKDDNPRYRTIELLIKNTKTLEIIAQALVFKVIDRAPSDKSKYYDIITNKDFYLKIVLRDNDLNIIRTTEFGLCLLNGLFTLLFKERTLPVLELDLEL